MNPELDDLKKEVFLNVIKEKLIDNSNVIASFAEFGSEHSVDSGDKKNQEFFEEITSITSEINDLSNQIYNTFEVILKKWNITSKQLDEVCKILNVIGNKLILTLIDNFSINQIPTKNSLYIDFSKSFKNISWNNFLL